MKVLDSKDESAIGLSLVGVFVVLMVIFLGEVATSMDPAGPGPGSPTETQQQPGPDVR